jgi:hypothetical protein
MPLMLRLAYLGIVVVAWSCSGSGGQPCIPGATQKCACPGTTVQGAQTCTADGKGFGACQGCGGTTVSGASTSSAASTGAGTPGACDVGDTCNNCVVSDCAAKQCPDQVKACKANDSCTKTIACWHSCLNPMGMRRAMPGFGFDATPTPDMPGAYPSDAAHGGSHGGCFQMCLVAYPSGNMDSYSLFQCAVCETKACNASCEGGNTCAMKP